MKVHSIIWDVDCEKDKALLPTEIELPDGMTDEDEISDYLSEMTGYCHKGFALAADDEGTPLDTEKREELMKATAEELASFLTSKLNLPFPLSSEFGEYAFATIDETWAKETDLDLIRSGASGWFGIKSVDLGFDDYSSLYLVVDYYGGGTAQLITIYEHMDQSDAKAEILKAIVTALDYLGERCTSETLMIVEIE